MGSTSPVAVPVVDGRRTGETAALRLYLARHVEVDEGHHGPLARRLLSELCGEDEARWRRATKAARGALIARRRLWDEVVRSFGTPAFLSHGSVDLHLGRFVQLYPSTRRASRA